MVTILLSPCLYIKNNEIQNLVQLFDVLNFSNDFLDAKLGLSDECVLAEKNWYCFPQYKPSIYNYFSALIVPLLQNMLCNYISNEQSDNSVPYEIVDKQYTVTDLTEFTNLAQYIAYIKKSENYIFFVGDANRNINDSFKIIIGDLEVTVPVIKELLYDETGNYNQYIKEDIKNYDEPFPCKKLCPDIKKMILETGNKSLFKKYGKIIAERNGFSKLPYSPRQYKNVPYYIRNDKEYVVCIDTLHGTFEVFKSTSDNKYGNYIGEFDFSCNKIEEKSSSPQTHKCYK